jgi:hypothetical protein
VRGTKSDNVTIVIKCEFGKHSTESGEVLFPNDTAFSMPVHFDVHPATPEGIEFLGALLLLLLMLLLLLLLLLLNFVPE